MARSSPHPGLSSLDHSRRQPHRQVGARQEAGRDGQERQAHQEGIELSLAIHDTTAQTANMIALGIDGVMRLAGDSNPKLTERLAATEALSRSAMWELRRPIDMGRIFEGRDLARVLGAHTATFAKITSVPAEMVQSGREAPLSGEAQDRPLLRRPQRPEQRLPARAGRQGGGEAGLRGRRRTSVRIRRRGRLPEDYAERGRGFSGMETDAERMGGSLIVESGEQKRGRPSPALSPPGPPEEEADMASTNGIRVMLVDDHPITRRGLREVLEDSGGFDVAAQAADGVEAVARAKEARPDVAVMDVIMPKPKPR